MKKIKLYIGSVICLLGCVTLLNSCTDNGISGPDTSGIQLELKTYRFDTDLYALDSNNIETGLVKLKEKYPQFLDFFLDTLMAYGLNGNYSDTMPGIREGLIPFITFKDYAELEQYIKQQYPDTKETDKSLTEGFKTLKYYFPNITVPDIYYLNLGLSRWTAFPVDSNTQCIALDMFLGDDFPHYASVNEPAYMKQHRRSTYIPVSVFSSLFRLAYPLKTQEKNLLELMLQRGKEQYFLHCILPGTPDSVLLGFNAEQTKWCEENEAFVYNFFVRNELLFNKEAMTIMSYITDGPFARGIEPPSNEKKVTPGNIGTWLGYKMIKSYMQQHKDMTLQKLLATEFNPTTFLADAKYKPR